MVAVGDINVFPKHLKAGDAEPEVNESKYTLLAFRFCPYCERVRLALQYHDIDHDLIPVSLIEKPTWLQKYSPSGKVPVLLNLGDRLFESDLITRFVDELRGPESSLMAICGVDTFKEAGIMAGQFFKPAHAILFDSSFEKESATAFYQACEQLCGRLRKGYFDGDRLSLADLLLFPMVDRFEVVLNRLNDANPDRTVELTDCPQYPELISYLTRMRQFPFVAAVRSPARLQALFAVGKRQGQANADLVL